MSNNLVLMEKDFLFNNVNVKQIEGGFGEGNKAILAKQVAEIHNLRVKDTNQLIRRHADYFTSDDVIDILDPKYGTFAKDNNLFSSNAERSIFLLSEKGYVKLVTLTKNSDTKKQVMNDFINQYFTMRKHLKNVAKIAPSVYAATLPDTITKDKLATYIKNTVDIKNIDVVIPEVIQKLKSLNDKGMLKTEVMTKALNEVKKFKEDNKDNLMYFDLQKVDYYIQMLQDYKINVLAHRVGGTINAYNNKVNEIKQLEAKIKEMEDESWTPDLEEKLQENINEVLATDEYQDFIESFKKFRNFIHDQTGESYQDISNRYYNSLHVLVPQAKECINRGYESKFHYLWYHYADLAEVMINKMHRDAVRLGFNK